MKTIKAFIILLLFTGLPAHADIMLLVHGYLGDADSWEKTGINDELALNGWARGGMFRGSPAGPRLYLPMQSKDSTSADKTPENLVFVATLPSQSTVLFQSDILKTTIDIIAQRHPSEKIILVGHSAGGVVARMTLIRHQLKNIKALITIAAPHLGTDRADQALNITANHGPFNMVKSFVGGSDYQALRRSRGLLIDLRYPQPGNMLFWLNNQPHPAIQYASVIRIDNNGMAGDYYVPGFSQNMNNVPVLRGSSTIFTTPTSHFLLRQDADTILSIIEHF